MKGKPNLIIARILVVLLILSLFVPTISFKALANTPNAYSGRALYIPVMYGRFVEPSFVLRIDGERADWSRYTPVLTDPQGDTNGGPNTDMKAAFSTKDHLYVYGMVEVYDPPLLKENATIELNLGLKDRQGNLRKLHTNITPDSFYTWMDTNGDGYFDRYEVPGIIWSYGKVVEFRIPLEPLGDVQDAQVIFVNFWTFIDGTWQGMDMME